MKPLLLDTDVFSFFFKRDTRAELYRPLVAGVQTCVSFQTVAELRCWTLSRRWSEVRRKELDEALSRCVVLPFDDAMANHWAEVTATRMAAGRPIACGDAWIAASALRFGLTLLTHNHADFQGIEKLAVISHQ